MWPRVWARSWRSVGKVVEELIGVIIMLVSEVGRGSVCVVEGRCRMVGVVGVAVVGVVTCRVNSGRPVTDW